MKEIPLTQAKVAYVDDEFYDSLLQRGAWHAVLRNRTWYAVQAKTAHDGTRKIVGMHTVVWQLAGRKVTQELDHRNHSGCDNRLANLRPATHIQQSQNRRKRQGSASRFKGVTRCRGQWRARIGQRYLGLQADEEAAARLCDQAARELYGEFACLNFPESS
jgi:hypothetical protein